MSLAPWVLLKPHWCLRYFQYNLSMGIDLINSGQSKICFVGAAESGLVPEVYEGFAAAKGLAEDKNLINLQTQLGEY